MTSFEEMLVVLIEMICVVVVSAYVVTRTGVFREALKGKVTWKSGLFMVLFFGLLSIFGTYSGLEIMGAKVNVRDLGPMIAGLIGGPFVGVGAGLIGGLQRYSLGGITVIPCSISTILAGLFGGMINLSVGRRFVGLKGAVLFAILMEGFHMLLSLIIVQPWETAWAIISSVAIPMIFANALGMAAFAFIVGNYVHEEETKGERDRLNTELQKEKAELEMAKEIQQSILPKSLPSWNGYSIAAVSRPARQVGGDFYDFFTMGNGGRTAVIADVSGKGMPAALYMAVSRTVIRVAASNNDDIGELLARSNVELVRENDMGMFVTLFGIEVLENGEIRYANSGHNPPVRVTSANVEFLPEGGVAMGVAVEAQPLVGIIKMDIGDILVLYTDGVTDAVGLGGKEFGESGLNDAAGRLRGMDAKAALDGLMKAIDDHTGTELQYDDITVVILRREA